MKKVICLGCLAIVSCLFLILGVLVIFYFDPLVDSEINKQLIIENGTETFETWVDPPIVPYLKFHFFNVTNSDEFLANGDKPVFDEIGPYVYREHWEKVNVTFHENGTVSYETLKHYYFERSLSSGSEDDLVHTLDIPAAVAIDRVKDSEKLVKLAISSMLQVLNKTVFTTRSVKDLVWGYDDPLLDIGNKFLPPEKRIPIDKFGFFYEKNGSTDGLLNVFTGKDDITKYTIIDSFNHSSFLKFWSSPECNMVNGTDGTSFPPNVNRQSQLYLFNENLCRSLPLTYLSDVEHYDIKGYRFSPPADVFDPPSLKQENECYCLGGPPCIGGGVFNISACQFGSPTIMSWPHFFQADEKYLEAVVGLNPDHKKHQLFIDIAPRTGFPLAAQARLQINIATVRIPEIKAAANMTSMIFPIVWFEDGVDQLPDKLIVLLQRSSNLPEVMKSSLMLGFFILGGVLMVACIISCLYIQIQRRSYLDISHGDKGHVNNMVSPDYPD